MGTVVDLAARRAEREAAPEARAHCFVDLSCPFSYLAAERVQRGLPNVAWEIASNAAVDRRDPACDAEHAPRVRAAVERRAAELRIPLTWPDRFPDDAPAAMRAGTLAVELGRGGEFILAAGRLAYSGGFDLEEPDVLVEAAAAAHVDLDACLAAARDPSRDSRIEQSSRGLLAAGAQQLPALRVGGLLLSGERQISAYLSAGPRTVAR